MKKVIAGVGLVAALVLGIPAAAQARVIGPGKVIRANTCLNTKVPNVIGMSETDARNELNRYGFRNLQASIQKESAALVVVQTRPDAGTLYNQCDVVTYVLGE